MVSRRDRSGLRGLQIGPLVADAVDVSDVVLPVADFALTGLGVGNLALDGIAALAASVDRATVKQLSGPTLPLGDLTLSNLALLKAEAADITTAGLDVEGTSNPLVFTCDIGVLDISPARHTGGSVAVGRTAYQRSELQRLDRQH